MIIVVSLLLGFFWKDSSGSDATALYQQTPWDKIFALHNTDAQTYWAVGNMGLILKSTDAAETWVKMSAGVDEAFNDITFVDKNGWIVGESGLILFTRDGGSHWEKQSSNTNVTFQKIFFLDNRRGIVVGDAGAVLLTENGGSSWQAYPLDWTKILPADLVAKGIFAPTLWDVFFTDEAHGWISGDAGVILFSADGGKTWNLLKNDLSAPIFSLYFKNALEGFAVGHGGFFGYTEDGGKTWHQQNSFVKENLNKIRFSGKKGIVVGNRGTILQTVDEGKSWVVVNAMLRPPVPWFLDVVIRISPKEEVICAGQGGFMKITLSKEDENK